METDTGRGPPLRRHAFTWWNLTPVMGRPYWCSLTNVGLEDLRSKVRQWAELVPTPNVSPSVSKATADTFRGSIGGRGVTATRRGDRNKRKGGVMRVLTQPSCNTALERKATRATATKKILCSRKRKTSQAHHILQTLQQHTKPAKTQF